MRYSKWWNRSQKNPQTHWKIEFILCDDAKDVLGKVVAVGRLYGSGNRLEQGSVAALSRLHSKDVIPGVLGNANQRIIELLVKSACSTWLMRYWMVSSYPNATSPEVVS